MVLCNRSFPKSAHCVAVRLQQVVSRMNQLVHTSRSSATVFFGFAALVCLCLLVVSVVWTRGPSITLSLYQYADVTCYEDIEKNHALDAWFSTFVLIVVPIRPADKDSRQLIRDTWFEGFHNSQDVALRFALGTRTMPLKEQRIYTKENETFGDIIFVDTTEDFAALTNKTLAIINWAHRHVNFSYFMKCNDTSYVFVENMIVELRREPTATKLYYGHFMVDQGIHDSSEWPDDKWDIGSHYLPFARGGGYIISQDLVAILSRDTPHLKWHINEDTAVGAWLSTFDHKRKSHNRFCYWWKGRKPSKCKQPVLIFAFHGFSNVEVKQHFNNFHEQVSSKNIFTML